VRYLFENGFMNRIRLTIHSDNVASRRVAEKCGTAVAAGTTSSSTPSSATTWPESLDARPRAAPRIRIGVKETAIRTRSGIPSRA
jgi:hypothetical protein